MPNINNELINEIRAKSDIVEIISGYLPLTKRGKNYFGVCPFHDDHSPSMSVSSEKQIYTCFSCGATGNVFTFISEYEHLSYYDTIALLGNKLGIKLSTSTNENNKSIHQEEYDIYKYACKFYQNNINTSLGQSAIEYLNKRKIDSETIKKFEIGLALKNSSLTEFLTSKKYPITSLIELGLTNDSSNDSFNGRIMFPLYDLSGSVVGFSGRIYNTKDSSKYINTKETPIFRKGNTLYNYHRAIEHLKKTDTLIVMEGFMDVIRASTVGINNAVATMGTAVTKFQANLIKKSAKNIILCFDGDEAGEEATISCANLLESIDVTPKIIRLKENLDPDEYIIKYGGESFKRLIDNPLSLIDFKMNQMKKTRNLSSIEDISKYVEDILKELMIEKDDILIDLTLKKISKEYNISLDILNNKYQSLKKDTVTKEPLIKDILIKKDYLNKYNLAERSLILGMLKEEKVIHIFENNVTYLPTMNLRFLANEIITYYHKYHYFEIADFITYLSQNEVLIQELNKILSSNIIYNEEGLEEYLNLIKEYNANNRIKDLESSLKKESDPLKQAEILEEIKKIKLLIKE